MRVYLGSKIKRKINKECIRKHILQNVKETNIRKTKRWLKHKGNSRNLVSRLSRETINSSKILKKVKENQK